MFFGDKGQASYASVAQQRMNEREAFERRARKDEQHQMRLSYMRAAIVSALTERSLRGA